MSLRAVTCAGIGKLYRIGETVRYRTLRDDLSGGLARWARFAVRRDNGGRGAVPSKLWALRDISFEIDCGERVAVIGHNGAGKSTLLKILSRITKPTKGRAAVFGRVGSLLEIGTGFHPELTGRENVFLSGAILGMSRPEIRQRFERIVEFAGVAQYIDTPVKRFSSGMYMRLGFSVAAHLEPDILLVDEVLSVGDAAFQRKCIGQLEELEGHGRTVVFVSHNLGLVRSICSRGLVLDHGTLIYDGPIDTAITTYMDQQDLSSSIVDLRAHVGRPPRMEPLLRAIRLFDKSGAVTSEYNQGDVVGVELSYSVSPGTLVAGAGITIERGDGLMIGNLNTFMTQAPPWRMPSSGVVRFTLDAAQLIPDEYVVTAALASSRDHIIDKVDRAAVFAVHAADLHGSGYQHGRGDGAAVLRAEIAIEESVH
jgi:lipopolysaccharide transport system ATP-binding protein